MKAATFILVLALFGGSQAAQARQLLSPVTRVVQLLKGLAEQTEKEGKAEEDMYESFVCWGKSVIEQKTASNSEAESRIDALATYIADLAGGKVDLTSEEEDLIKEIAGLEADISQMDATRDKENKDFEASKDEMTKAINAMKSAIKVLNDATKDNKKGALLAYHAQLNNGAGTEALEADSANLNAAVDMGERYLSKADASFLRRVLTGDVPERDEKMLAKKATFKMAYKTRSGKIQGLLAKLKGQFESNLKDAEDKEKDSKDAYDKLSKSKKATLKKATDAKGSMAVEGAARGKAGATAKEEKEALETQVKDDSRFIQETTDSLATKKDEWDARSKLRDGELAAISKAINILYSDDARDNFKKSFASQEGFFFLQEASTVTSAALGRMVTSLEAVAKKTGNKRLAAIAELAALAPKNEKGEFKKFKPVLTAIDKMLATLKSDEKTDLETKETCEKERMDNTREGLLLGRAMDDQTDAIRKLESEIADLVEDMKKLKEQKKKEEEELVAAEELRKEENTAWKTTDAEDKEAAATVKDATKVLKDYYSTAFAFVQVGKSAAPTVVDGEAPPPPPATWDGGYGGKKGESTGIISILEMVYDDIKKDQKKAKEEEDQSQTDFDKYEKESKASTKALQDSWDKKDGIKGDKITDKSDTIGARKTKKGTWDGVMKLLKTSEEECEYYAVNFKMRAANRAIEVDGLNNAKAILSGGSFK